MGISTKKLIKISEAVTKGHITRERDLHVAIIGALSDWQRYVLDYLINNGPTSGGVLADTTGLSINHTSTMLKQLHDFGLLDRRPLESEQQTGTLLFEYSVRNYDATKKDLSDAYAFGGIERPDKRNQSNRTSDGISSQINRLGDDGG